jgi:hypothetical protein
MLKTVVDPRVASLSVGIFLFTVSVDQSVALAVIGATLESKGYLHKPEGSSG